MWSEYWLPGEETVDSGGQLLWNIQRNLLRGEMQLLYRGEDRLATFRVEHSDVWLVQISRDTGLWLVEPTLLCWRQGFTKVINHKARKMSPTRIHLFPCLDLCLYGIRDNMGVISCLSLVIKDIKAPILPWKPLLSCHNNTPQGMQNTPIWGHFVPFRA